MHVCLWLGRMRVRMRVRVLPLENGAVSWLASTTLPCLALCCCGRRLSRSIHPSNSLPRLTFPLKIRELQMFRQVCEGFEEERKMMEVKYSEIAKLLQQVRILSPTPAPGPFPTPPSPSALWLCVVVLPCVCA